MEITVSNSSDLMKVLGEVFGTSPIIYPAKTLADPSTLPTIYPFQAQDDLGLQELEWTPEEVPSADRMMKEAEELRHKLINGAPATIILVDQESHNES
jgi:hypothetical protein